MKTEWLEVVAKGDKRGQEVASAILIEAGSPGVEEVEEGMLRAFLRPVPEDGLRGLERRLSLIGWSFEARPFRDKDWLEEWKRFLRPVRIRPLFVHHGFAHTHIPHGCIPVEIEPSMAFGTGTHASTRLSLKALVWLLLRRERLFTGKKEISLLDVGTGSGILAMAASKLGAERVVATDIDGVALKKARRNARKNKTPVRITGRSLSEIRGGFSVVVANIIKESLLSLSEGLVARTMKGGYLVLSGLLREDEAEVLKRFRELSLSPEKRFVLKEWVALVMKRP